MSHSASAGDTVCTQLTPAGRSAIAVVAVAGPRALVAVDACFQAANGKQLASQPAGAIRFGHWGGEELIVCRHLAAGDETPIVEVHCHGGHAAVRAVLDSLAAQGCDEITWQQWIVRQTPSSMAADAEAALAASLTERTASILLDQLDGALQRDVQTALAALDRNDTAAAQAIVEVLVDRGAIGQRLTTPWRVLLAGPPNVGKSSLMNVLVGYERAVVYDQPGTTRDVVTATTAIDGWPVEFFDTAGMRHTDDDLEAAGVALARSLLARTDLVLVVAEAADNCETGWQPIESQLSVDTRCLRVASKRDRSTDTLLPSGVITTSATTGTGVRELLASISTKLVPAPPPAGAAVPFTRQHHEQLAQSHAALRAGDLSAARSALHAVLAVNSNSLSSS